jgi:Glycosyl hydrolase family 71
MNRAVRRRPGCGLVAVAAALGVLTLGLAAPAAAASSAAPASSTAASPTAARCPNLAAVQPGHPLVLAHMYLWFDTSSWNRAKIDYPAIGRYSSDDPKVMAKQVAEAQAAGINGFIVGWRDTPVLDTRLALLRKVAAAANFKLAITYQAQDFNRKPLPVAQTARDLQTLAAMYGSDPVFHTMGARPLVAFSGTWDYSEQDLHSIIAPVASRLMVLATEKSAAGYQRVAPAVGGELYYWSSPDPENTKGYTQRLMDMANAVRAHCGVWVAPVSPGFDARLVGGHSIVDRRDGATLRSSWEAALATVPEAIGLISWNEFSENTYVEPSVKYGTRYLDVVRELTASPPPPEKELESSSSSGAGPIGGAVLAGSVVVGGVALVTIVGIRRRRADRS